MNIFSRIRCKFIKLCAYTQEEFPQIFIYPHIIWCRSNSCQPSAPAGYNHRLKKWLYNWQTPPSSRSDSFVWMAFKQDAIQHHTSSADYLYAPIWGQTPKVVFGSWRKECSHENMVEGMKTKVLKYRQLIGIIVVSWHLYCMPNILIYRHLKNEWSSE